jgi:hypothetical protein
MPIVRRNWQLDFGPVSAAAGTITTINVKPQCDYRVEKVMATDTAPDAGTGTRIQSIFVGNQLQRPASTSTLTKMFFSGALGNAVMWAICKYGSRISITIEFLVDCQWDMTTFGTAWE